MTEIHRGRFSADIDGDFVVFLIGMRPNKPWRVHKWLPLIRQMRDMLQLLAAERDRGLLGVERAFIGGPAFIQYWRSVDDLLRFSRTAGEPHVKAWQAFNRNVGSGGDVGIWHETYQVRDGGYECIYGNMPAFGLAAATRHVPLATKGISAAKRIGASPQDAPPPAGV